MGYEFSGTVTEVGDDVQDLIPGQKVAAIPPLDDRHYNEAPYFACKASKRNLCQKWAAYGPSAPGGGFAQMIVIKAVSCVALPETVSLKGGALVEPLAVAWHSIRLSGFEKGQKAVILGAGPIGLKQF